MAAAVVAGIVPGQTEENDLRDWMARQNDVSAALMLRAISATHLVKERAGFGQTIRPLPGSVLASTALGSWDPDPDYFFHWLRNSALVIDALRHLIAEGALAGEGLSRFKEFVAFSLSLNRLDGASFLRLAGDFRNNIDPSFLQYVRDDSELCADCRRSRARRAAVQPGRNARHLQMVAPATRWPCPAGARLDALFASRSPR